MADAADIGRALLLYGTAEPVEPTRHLQVGALSAELERGNLRTVRWGGLEVIRSVAFIVRDTTWGTLAPRVSGLAIEETADRFRVAYEATLDPADGSFAYRAEIVGTADGHLSFRATGKSAKGFTTCRTGFVVLHPLDGVVGRKLDVVHAAGGRSTTSFPKLADPSPPATDIRELMHAPVDGLSINVRLEGEPFEMEDHRNWTDASFKTYVRPLSLGYPYRIDSGDAVVQAVLIDITGPPPAPSRHDVNPTVTLGSHSGRVPGVGLFLPRNVEPMSAALVAGVAEMRPSYLIGRVDGRDRGATESLRWLWQFAAEMGCPLELEVVIPGIDPGAELAAITSGFPPATSSLAGVFVTPQRDLKTRPANTVPPGEASPTMILAAARAAFPKARIGGGMPCGFPELNRNRPPAGIDFITHATQATYHAADDQSVMETLEALPHVIASTRAIAGDIPYRLSPATIGLPDDWTAGTPATNPYGRRVAMAENDPRQHGLFAAAFALGYAAVAAGAGIDSVSLAAPSGLFGAFDETGQASPIATVVSGLMRLARAPRIAVEVRGTRSVAALAAEGPAGPVLWLANLGPMPVRVELAGRKFVSIRLLDAAGLAARPAEAVATRAFDASAAELDAFAICCLS